MTYLVSGKVLETIGAILVAYVGFRAAILEVMIGRYFRRHSIDRDALRREAAETRGQDVEKLRKGLEAILEQRHRQFGFYEAILVGSGTTFVALGCALYLVGILMGQH